MENEAKAAARASLESRKLELEVEKLSLDVASARRASRKERAAYAKAKG
jgi:hypothetical protein